MSHRSPSRPTADAERQDWNIEKLVPGGDGMARLADGRVAFAAGALPGDVIRPLAIEGKKGHVRAGKWHLVTASPARCQPVCPVAEACGGCDWMVLERSAQITHKVALLRDALERVGGFSELPAGLRVRPVGPDTGYRRRVRFHIDASGKVGFHARHSHTLVEVPGCVVCDPALDAALTELRRVPEEVLAAFSEVELRSAEEEPRISAFFVPRAASASAAMLANVTKRLPRDWSTSAPSVAGVEGTEQRYPLPEGVSLRAAPGVFTQVNWDVNAALVQTVLDGARGRGVRRFVDAYAGAGNFSLPLLAAGMQGVSVERDAQAVACARRSAADRTLEAGGFVVDEAAAHLERLARKGERFDLVLLDPPRAGAREALPAVVKLGAPFVAMCSCDPVTLARDLSTLRGSGYRLDEVQGFDMFPHTHHLETLAWMSRSK